MKKIKQLIILLLLSPIILADSVSINPAISYEQWQMPNNIQPMGVLGLHGLVNFNKNFYGGVGLYSAVAGNKGGFFALALEAGAEQQLFSQLFLDAGIRAGGGGGDNTPVGGGLFYEPYLGLKFNFSHFATELYYSYVNFVYGNISSDQIGLMLSFPFDSTNFKSSDYSNNYIAALSKIYFPDINSLNNNGQALSSNIEFLGFEFAHFISQKLFFFFNFSGAVHGNGNGYADELLGLGYQFPLLNSNFFGIIKLAAGSGGGGNINTGGGLILNPLLGLEYKVNSAFGIELNGGYITAPEGNFSAKEAQILLKYYFSRNHNGNSNNNYFRIRILNQTYFNPQASDGTINPTMQLLGLDLDYFVSHYFYITGQSAFAYIGQNTGGYFSGLLGIGAQTPTILHSNINFFSEVLAGTAGGAGLDIGDGALVEPVLGLQYKINQSFSLQTSVGYLVAVSGGFHPVTFNVGIGYLFL